MLIVVAAAAAAAVTTAAAAVVVSRSVAAVYIYIGACCGAFFQVTTARRFVIKVTKCVAMPARFVTNEMVTNRAAIVPF